MSKEYKIRNGLVINDSTVITGITNDSGLTNLSTILPTSNAVKGYVDSKISTESSILNSQINSVAVIISNETSQRISVDSSLSSIISTEISQRTSVDSSIVSSLSSEISTRTNADSSLNTSISIETSQRISVDSSLSTVLNNKLNISGGTLTGNLTGITLGLTSQLYLSGITNDASPTNVLYYNTTTKEITYGLPTGGSTDHNTLTNLQGGTTGQFYHLTSIEHSITLNLSSSISTEVSVRTSADASLTSAVSTTTSQRISSDASLTSAVSTTTSQRISVDTSLNTAISTEVSVRTSADASLTTSISSVSASLNTAISTEVSVRTSANASLTSAVSTTTSQRISSDASLTTSINGKLNITGGVLTGNLTGITLGLTSQLYLSGITNDASPNDVLYYNSVTKQITYGTKPSGGSATPGGSDTYVQFNDGGTTFGGHSGLTYSKITGNLTSSGLIKGSNIETNPTSLSVKIGIEAGKSEDQSASRRNIYIGFQSGQLATNGATDCVSIGYQSLFNNTTGGYNISIGTYASFTNGTGHSNVVLGYKAAFTNTSGSYSVYIGRASGEGVSTGSYNSCVGYGTGQYLGTSIGNVLFGSYAGAYLNNATGAANYNCFIGYQCASSSNINGDYNIGIGFSAFNLLTTGSYNIGIGNNCLTSVTTGINNTSIGLYSGMGGNVSNSIYLGAHAGRYEGDSNKLFIDSLNRTNETTARTDSLIYGEFNTTANLQNIYFNATSYTKRLVKTYQLLTSSASITMNVRNGQNARVVLGVSATLTLSNLIDGDEGNIVVTQDATGSRTLTISPTPKVINGGGGVITLTGTANSTDMLSYTYSNSVLYITYGKNYS